MREHVWRKGYLLLLLDQCAFALGILSMFPLPEESRHRLVTAFVLAIVMLGLAWFRQRKHLIFYWLGHILILVMGYQCQIFLLQDGLGFLVILLFTILSLLAGLVHGWEQFFRPTFLQMGILAFLFLSSAYDQNEIGIKATYSAIFLLVLLKLYYENMIHTQEFIKNRRASTKLDERRLIQLNNGITGLYTGVLGILLFAISWINADELSRGVIRLVRELVKRLLAFLQGDPVEQAVSEETEMAQQMDLGSMLAGEPKEPGALAKFLDQVAGAVLGIALVVAVLLSVAVAMYQYFYGRKKDELDVAEFLAPFSKEEKIERTARARELPQQSPAKKIRKLYRKRVRRLWGKQTYIPPSLTPVQEIEKGEQEKGGQEKQLVELYERARYSQHEVTKEDVEQFRSMLEADRDRKEH